MTLEFTRFFTSGTLAGLTHDDSLTFVDRGRAAAWVRGIRRNSRAGQLNYRLTRIRAK